MNMSQQHLIERMERVKLEIDQRLTLSYPSLQEADSLEETYSAMRYMILLGGGGKRFRPALTMEACRLFGGSEARAWEYAQGVEEIHTYTLILDDIQDKSDQRRHQQTCHVHFGINTALLAAMRLFERGVAPFHRFKEDDAQDCRRLLDLLHRGQAADLAAESWPVAKRTAAALNFIHGGKTSALFQLAVLGGAVAADAPPEPKKALIDYGYYLGLAFQSRDDVLSMQSSVHVIGKPAGEAADAHKLTYPVLFGPEAMAEAERMAEHACDCLARMNVSNAGFFEGLAQFAVARHQ